MSSSSSSSRFSDLPSGGRPNDAKSGPKGQPMTPILSASLIVLCPSQQEPSDLATLMLQRSARMGSSFRSAVVFPGGALDLADEAAVGCSTSEAEKDNVQDAAYMRALQLCSLRETFEETGLLLMASSKRGAESVPYSKAIGAKESGMTAKEWAQKRDEVHNNAAKFPPFLLQVAGHLGLASGSDELPLPPLSYHSHWITPRSVVRPGKRFSAHFFLTALEDSMPETQRSPHSADSAASKEDLPALALSADGSETLSLKVAPVQHYIRAAMQDEILLYPPQFYILSDIYATTQPQTQNEGTDARLARLRPHIFGHREETVTPVEEEPRHLGSRNYAWDRETSKPTGWVSSSAPPLGSQKQGDRVTAVEPRALPKSGSNLPTKSTDEDPPFVFPLVLPGDWQASRKQQQQRRGDTGTDLTSDKQGTTSRQRPINRIFVSPRLKEDGGGLMAKGARREGLPGLCDWVVGQGVPDFPEGEDERTEREAGKTNKARL